MSLDQTPICLLFVFYTRAPEGPRLGITLMITKMDLYGYPSVLIAHNLSTTRDYFLLTLHCHFRQCRRFSIGYIARFFRWKHTQW